MARARRASPGRREIRDGGLWKAIEVESDDGETEEHLIAKAYFVFNVAQVDGFKGNAGKASATAEDLSEDERVASAEQFFANPRARLCGMAETAPFMRRRPISFRCRTSGNS
jgi:antirestriction protein ArdC